MSETPTILLWWPCIMKDLFFVSCDDLCWMLYSVKIEWSLHYGRGLIFIFIMGGVNYVRWLFHYLCSKTKIKIIIVYREFYNDVFWVPYFVEIENIIDNITNFNMAYIYNCISFFFISVSGLLPDSQPIAIGWEDPTESAEKAKVWSNLIIMF